LYISNRKDNIDSTEKKTLGEVWETTSQGRRIFRLVTGIDCNSVDLSAITRQKGSEQF